jgi:hypothetical protein
MAIGRRRVRAGSGSSNCARERQLPHVNLTFTSKRRLVPQQLMSAPAPQRAIAMVNLGRNLQRDRIRVTGALVWNFHQRLKLSHAGRMATPQWRAKTWTVWLKHGLVAIGLAGRRERVVGLDQLSLKVFVARLSGQVLLAMGTTVGSELRLSTRRASLSSRNCSEAKADLKSRSEMLGSARRNCDYNFPGSPR